MYFFQLADFDGLRSALSENPLSSVICPDNDDIEGNWVAWKTAFSKHIEMFIPIRKLRKFVTPPWIDGEALHAIKKKQSLRKRALQKDSPSLWEKYRQLRKDVKFLIRSKHIVYLKDILDSCFSQPGRFWGYFNRLTKRSPVPDTVELNGSSYSTADSKTAVFSSYFSSVFNTDRALPDDLPSTPQGGYSGILVTGRCE